MIQIQRPALQACDHGAGLAGNQASRAVVPGAQARLKEHAGPARRDVAQIQGRRAEAPHVLHNRERRGKQRQRARLQLGIVQGAAEDQKAALQRPVAAGQAFAVEVRALAALGPVELVHIGVVDQLA